MLEDYMPRAKRKKEPAVSSTKGVANSVPLDPLRTGMPALDSITGVEEFRKGKKVFRIIHTNEVDEYEQVPSKAKRKKR
jgi:hypothetical protein